MQYTPNFHLAYLDASTPLVQLADASQQVAQSLDAAMGRAGYVPPDTTTFAALAARVAKLAPVVYEDLGQGGTWTAPAPFASSGTSYFHPRRTIDPAAIFGAGFGAVVELDSTALLDLTSGATAASWYLNVVCSPQVNTGVAPADPSTLIRQGFGYLASPPGRLVIVPATKAVIIPAGKVQRFASTIAAPGSPTTSKATTYSDATNNVLSYTVHPIPPTS